MGMKGFYYEKLSELIKAIFQLTNVDAIVELNVAVECNDEIIEQYKDGFEYPKGGIDETKHFNRHDIIYSNEYIEFNVAFIDGSQVLNNKIDSTKEYRVFIRLIVDRAKLAEQDEIMGNSGRPNPVPLLMSALTNFFGLCKDYYLNASPYIALQHAGDALVNVCMVEGNAHKYELEEQQIAKDREYLLKQNDAIHIDLQLIAHLKYEKAANSGTLVVLPNLKTKGWDSSLEIKFTEPVSIKDYKLVRKLLEIAKDNKCLIGDKRDIFGIADNEKLLNIFDQERLSNQQFSMTKVEFKGTSWELKIFRKDKWQSVFINKDGIYQYHSNFQKNLEDNLVNRFGSDKLKTLQTIIEYAKEQAHGTMIVISSHAKSEAERLANCCISIKPQKLNQKIIKLITGIDGAVLIDSEGVCHAIGVILDGEHNVASGESIDRGARHNSARRYAYWAENVKNKDKEKHKCVCVIVSEDGDVSHTQ